MATATVLDDSDRDSLTGLELATSSFVLDDMDDTFDPAPVALTRPLHPKRSTRAIRLTDADLLLGIDPPSEGHNPFSGGYKLF
jgi:hypothetical protein